jgi:ATP-dependent protease Clp ATPase subunit
MEDVMLDVMFKIPSSPEIKGCTITSAVVTDNASPAFIFEEIKKRA